MTSTISSNVVNGVIWVTLGRIGERLFHFVFSIILARLLFPEDFGTIGMVSIFFGFANIIATSGMGASLVQLADLREQHLHSAFWITLLISTALTILIFFSAPWIAQFYQIPILTTLTQALSFVFIISAFQRIPFSLLQRNMEFGKIGSIQVIDVALSGIVGVVLAYCGAGVWSLVAQNLVGNVISSLLFTYVTKWYPRFMFSRKSVKEIWAFSINYFFAQSLQYWSRQGDNLIIGLVFNATALGYYVRSYALLLIPLAQVVGIIQVVMFPALASIKDDKVRVKGIFLRSMSMIAIIIFPMMLGLSAVAEPFILVIYGNKWNAMIPLVKILAFVSVFQSLAKPTQWIYLSQGRTDRMFRWRLVTVTIEIIGFLIGANLGSVSAMAFCYMLVTVGLFYPEIVVAGKLIDLNFQELTSYIWQPLFGSIVMVAVVMLVKHLIPIYTSHTVELLILVGTGIIIYSTFILVFQPRGWKELIVIIKNRMKKKSQSL